ncbi:signal recognition particle protein [Rhizobium leguminosarum]|uniref:signal recognition particle protein n=1 Tax=Rhizobium leguminosarum TaxID=384 RepID=UPI001C9463CB|nr:signal recognition particle protein [Rhizobium leguminosarum]MBY5611886.1 signal recognition particle protein [Rhizobium leguminosarum]MBY5658087.1 signal recognition particle protein [Rhizobium leguminosarum]MBY5672863.1 signal recognition particle protein [Rhizobium leguminosarum]MBY5686308.1 signal recognition particle protein [Rhizobium leguminosarum]
MFENLQDRLGSILNGLTGRGALSEADVSAALREVRRALLEADVALDVVRSFTDRVREKAVGAEILKSIKPGQMVVKIVHDELIEMLGGEGVGIDLHAPAPVVVMMVGLQGSGKTTTSAKIAHRLSTREKKKVLMASLDTRRPAAQEQLRQLGAQANIDTLPVISGQSPTDIAARAVQAAKLGGHDVVILDTAGRTHIDEPLMVEMADIKKRSNPHEILLVADSLTGQDAVNLARSFDERVGITGLVLTRMDGDGRGGAALSMRAVTGKPIKLIGVGEKMSELEEFHPRRIADRILGMGDIVSLVERASENIDAEKAAAMAAKMAKGKFDLDDLADQLRQMQKMGGMGGIMGMMPGMAGMKDKMAAAGLDDKLFGRQIAIIQSMTKAERTNPDLLKHSRKKRIAAGSGTDAAAINKLLKMHRQMADMMKMMGGKGKGGMMKQMMGGLAGKMGLGGMGGMAGSMPDLSNIDPRQLEALQKQAEAAGLGKPGGGMPGLGGLPGGLSGLGGAKLPGLGGGFPGLPGLPKKK